MSVKPTFQPTVANISVTDEDLLFPGNLRCSLFCPSKAGHKIMERPFFVFQQEAQASAGLLWQRRFGRWIIQLLKQMFPYVVHCCHANCVQQSMMYFHKTNSKVLNIAWTQLDRFLINRKLISTLYYLDAGAAAHQPWQQGCQGQGTALTYTTVTNTCVAPLSSYSTHPNNGPCAPGHWAGAGGTQTSMQTDLILRYISESEKEL